MSGLQGTRNLTPQILNILPSAIPKLSPKFKLNIAGSKHSPQGSLRLLKDQIKNHSIYFLKSSKYSQQPLKLVTIPKQDSELNHLKIPFKPLKPCITRAEVLDS